MNSCLVDGEHGVDADVGELAGHLGVQLSVEGGLGDLDEDVPLLLLGERDLHLVEDGQRLLLARLEALGDDARVQVVGDVQLRLLQELPDEQHCRGRAVARHVILGGRRPVIRGSNSIGKTCHHLIYLKFLGLHHVQIAIRDWL